MLIFVLSLLLSTFASPSSPTLDRDIRSAARLASLDPNLVRAIIRVESNFKSRAVSPKGAMGLMQVMPSFAAECEIVSPYHTVNHLMGACRCLRILINRYRGDLKLALAAYNAGPGNVAKYGGVPPFKETKQYIRKVLKTYQTLKRSKG